MTGPESRPGAVYAKEASSDHVGDRVSIRYLAQEPDGPRPTDVVGMLRRWDPTGRVAVERRDGSVAEFDAQAIIASRILGDEPPRRGRRSG